MALDAKRIYKIMQGPKMWLWTSQDLAADADRLLADIRARMPEFEKAVRVAHEKMDEGAETAEIECEEPSVMSACLLYGYALETVLKGLIVEMRSELVNGDKLDSYFKGHDLRSLAGKAALHLEEDKLQLLGRMTKVINWSGRYPVALRLGDHGTFPNPSRESVLSDDPMNDIACASELYRALEAQLHKKLGKPARGFGLIIKVDDPS